MTRPGRILITHTRHSAVIAPASPAVRAAIQRVGCKSMYTRNRSLAVPAAAADDVEAALTAAGLRVEVVLNLGGAA